MGDTDAGTVKARVVVEYDGSGISQAKEDLSSLADIVGGSLADSVGGANDALGGLDEQMGKSADSTAAFVASATALAKPLQASSDAVTSVTEAFGEQQSAIEDAGSAFESLQKPIEGTTALLEEASPPMLAIAKNAESMVPQIGDMNDSFAQINESLTQSVPLLPQFADSLHAVSTELDPKAFDAASENMAVFQAALSDPERWQTIGSYLDTTGQSWSGFFSSVGTTQSAFIDSARASSEALYDVNKPLGDISESIAEINKSGGIGTALYGPDESWAKLSGAFSDTESSISSMIEGGGADKVVDWSQMLGAPLGGDATLPSFADITQGFDSFMRPLMYAQMAGQMIGQVSQGIYNMAALAEGPAAHSVGTFTGAVDELGQHAQQTGEQFSESFGQGIKPMLDAINNVQSQGGGSGGILNGVGTFLSNTLGVMGDLGQIVGGGVIGGASNIVSALLTGNTNGGANDLVQQGWDGLQNIWANITGQPEPYPTPGVSGSQIDLSTIQTQLTTSIATMNAQANDPGYLAAQAYLQSQSGYATLGQASYNASHSTGETPFDYAPQAYQNSMMSQMLASGYYSDPNAHASTDDSSYGIGMADFNKAYFDQMAAKLPPITPFMQDELSGNCFPASTPILLADGTEKAIEALQIGEQVLAHDGARQVSTTILALIKPPPRRVYELTFDNGNTLILTDSHPISTNRGWKSLSPENTKKENPDLAVTTLQIGDCIHTFSGTCTLLAVEPREIVQIYNITVGNPHTFYASGVLVHNKILSSQIMQNVADTEVPSMDMKNSNLIQSMMGNFTDADLSHTFTATATWVGQGLTNTFNGVASWIGQGLTNAFTGIASWAGQGLTNAFTGVASWVGQGLKNDFTGIASWIGQGLTNAFTGVASWIGQGLTNTFTGVTDWIGQNLTHTFTGVANWVEQEVTQVVGSIPGFASGVEGFGGGLAVVGERGPELVALPKNSSVYPQSSVNSFSPLSMMGNNTPVPSGDVHIHFQVGSKEIAHEIIPQIAPVLRTYRGTRQ